MESKIIFITGGARSGKSTFAESKASIFGPNVTYLATSLPVDQEMRDRIKRHRLQRPSQWQTIEGYKNIGGLLQQMEPENKALLVDCLTVMVSNLIIEEKPDWESITPLQVDELEKKVYGEVKGLISTIRSNGLHGFIVSNELGMGLVPPYKLGRIFRDIAGRVNQMMAKEADEVYLVVSGIPLRIK